MPPKKAAAPEKKTLLGRPSNNLKIGIVGLFSIYLYLFLSSSLFQGLPNVGKSSFFNVLSETGTLSFYTMRPTS
jgi:obg-like ATPase 1